MANIYKHGTYGEYAQSIGAVPSQSKTVAVYIGTAPINLVAGYAEKKLVNRPIYAADYESAINQLGMSDDWATFTLCEAIKAHFNNPIGNAGPLIFINVLNPDIHRAEQSKSVNVTFTNGVGTIESDTIILDTVEIEGEIAGSDFSVAYNYITGKATITSLGDTQITGTQSVTFYEVATSDIDADLIIGDATDAGVYSGLGCIDMIYQTYNLIPALLAAPGWSDDPTVYNAMLAKSCKINGHWDAFVLADIPLTSAGSPVDTIAKAKTWQTTNGYTNSNSKVFWPQVKSAIGEVYHLSTLAAWEMMTVDSRHNGVPMETPSNKQIPIAAQYFGESSTNQGFDQTKGNGLNEVGITTAVYWGGSWVLWGPHTAAYKYGATGDAKNVFDNSIRMLMYVSNSFQSEHALTIDSAMTRAMADTIKNREQQKADALAAIGAFIGAPTVEFRATDNSNADLIEGNFTWSFAGTPTPPFKSGTLRVAYTSAGFNTFYEEE